MKYDFDLEERRFSKQFILKLLITLVEAVIVVFLAFTITRYGLEKMTVSGEYMIPTLKSGDCVLINKLSYRFHKIHRNDVIVVRQTGSEHSYFSLERVIGLPGERVQIKGLISDISHQTRTPVSNMKLYIEFLGEEELSEDGRQFLKKLQNQVERLDFLMQSMVKMSRLETGILQIQKEPGDICETLRRAVAAVVPDAAVKQIDLFMESSGEVMIDHDGRWTQEAVFNILDNAVKYTESGGEIHVALTRQEIFLKISISDTGKGIAPERQAEIFTRFYREPEVHDKPGVGIGLYLARRIMELQKGYIEVESEPGEGAEFRLYLPWRDAQDKV